MDQSSMEVQLPPPIDSGPSPLIPRHLVDLFFRPRRFFTSHLALGKTPYAAFVAWSYGAASSIDRLDQNLLRAEMGRPRPGWDALAPYVTESWPGFWLFVALSGAAGGLFLWWLGGWWFSVRVRWSGAAAPDRRLARLVMAYSAFIHAGPAVAAALIYTALFASYSEAFGSEEAYSLILLVFPFWSAAVSYTGVRSLFGVTGWRPRMWFLILPCLLYVVAVGALAAILSVVAPEPAV